MRMRLEVQVNITALVPRLSFKPRLDLLPRYTQIEDSLQTTIALGEELDQVCEA